MRQSTQSSNALGSVDGTISNGATWVETFEISVNSAEVPDADTSTWKFVFKHCDGGAISLTLTSGSEITVTQNTTGTLFSINCPQASLASMVGDYQADFAQLNGSTITHWFSGVVTFKEENLGF